MMRRISRSCIIVLLSILLYLPAEIVFAASEKCYVLVNNTGSFKTDVVTSSSVSIISRYIEPVEAPPPGGVRLDDCSYSVHLTESPEGYYISLSGRHLNSIGNSTKPGMGGYTQALLRAVYRTFDSDDMKKKVCRDYKELLASDCKPVEAVIFLFNEKIEMIPEGSVVRTNDRFNIMIQPVIPLYAYIIALDSSGSLFKVFPNNNVTSQTNPLNAGNQYYFPPLESEVIFAFDNIPGEEKLYFLLSASPVDEIEAFFDNLDGGSQRNRNMDSFAKQFVSRGFKLKKKTKQVTLKQTDTLTNLSRQKVMAELLKGSGLLVKTVTLKHVR